MKASEIRRSFLDFFAARDHQVVPSSPVVLPADPTLLFANAGMNQFKEIFLGSRESSFRRVTDTQKCIRVSGKHNDLEEVGFDTYHHTFFEMLGNWSFGDYYKREAVGWAWELMTGVWGLPKDRLWATVFREDHESEAIWKEVTDIDPAHILRFDEKDNFWEMGETGPCGPCSEIHMDLTADGCTPDRVNAGSSEVIELWNLVFIQHNRRADGSLEDLPRKHVDTGMGFERLVAVMQGKTSNYDTDVFQPLLLKLQDLTGRGYEGDDAVAMRVIVDHIRTLSFAMADGVMPSNEGRGYVLRRLLRRAVRFGRKLGFEGPFLGQLLPVLEDGMGGVFPELAEHRGEVQRALLSEEESFAATLDRGLGLFDGVVRDLKKGKKNVFPGDEAFKLYDTFGFPVDLTRLMASEHAMRVDEERFEVLMEEQRQRARGARKDALLAAEMDLVSDLVKRGLRSEFTGYEGVAGATEVLEVLSDGKLVDGLDEGDEGVLLLRATPFYAESGGQVGDQGTIRGTGGTFEVWDTQRPAEGLILHVGKVTEGRLEKGAQVAAEVEAVRRRRLQRHHSATHLLNGALREIVSPHVKQAGSLVAPDYLRFDFTHFEQIPADRLERIERRVNQWIMANDAVTTYEMDLKDVPGSGIVAVFDEKYGDVVRVVDIGGYSRELCGGTHAAATGDLGFFRIVSEGSIASGVRRIEAVCGMPAYEVARREHDLLTQLSQRFSATAEELPDRVETLLQQNRRLERQLKEQAMSAAVGRVDALADGAREVAGVTVIAVDVGEQDMDVLRGMMDKLRGRLPSGVFVLGSRSGGKACFVAAVSDDLVARGLHAGKLIGRVAKAAGGGGGGQPARAQAGGRDAGKVPEAIDLVDDLVRGMME